MQGEPGVKGQACDLQGVHDINGRDLQVYFLRRESLRIDTLGFEVFLCLLLSLLWNKKEPPF
jgi:hypothetical protein